MPTDPTDMPKEAELRAERDAARAFEATQQRAVAELNQLAARGAGTLSGYQGYDLRGQLERLLRTMTADDPNGTGAFAATRVRLALTQAIEGAQEAAFAAASGHQD